MKKSIITISRQFGSGGRNIAKRLAEELEIPFYDKEIISKAAEESGIDEETFIKERERTSRSYYFFGAIAYTLGSPMTMSSDLSLNDRIYIAQAEVIRELAEQGPCVIVGRCADEILSDNENVLNVYIHADIKDRINRVRDEYGVKDTTLEDVEEYIKRVDKQRANYYHYYTDRKWGNVQNYDISLNASEFSEDEIVSIIKFLVE